MNAHETRDRACKRLRVLRQKFNRARHGVREAARYESTRASVPKLKRRLKTIERNFNAALVEVEDARAVIALEHKK